MLITSTVLFLLCIQNGIAENYCKTVEETELIMAFLVHRHGDRTPMKRELVLSKDPELLARLTEPYGFGQLTDLGKARSFILGQFLRRRYNQFLSPSYNSCDIFVSSTDMGRTKMTAKIAISAAYSSRGMWSEELELVPLEVMVLPDEIVPTLSLLKCPEMLSYLGELLVETGNPKHLKMYDEVIDILSESLDFDLPKSPVTIYLLSNVLATQESVGMPLTDLDRRLMLTLRQGAALAVNYIFGNQKYVPLQAGGLLKEFFDTADQIISGADIPRLRVLSGHDITMYPFTVATRVSPKQGLPGYCSAYSLELRRCRTSGNYVVVPVYLKSPEEPEAYLEIEDCGVVCDYQKFRQLTAKNMLTTEQYRTRCKSDAMSPVDKH